MKTKVLILLTGLFLCLANNSFSQDWTEALRFSQRYLQSDARSMGAGNAFGAVGANFISTSINPAGLAFYRKSEMSFSTSFFAERSSSQYLNGSATDHKMNLSIPSLAMVLTNVNKVKGKSVTEGWVSYSLAAGINRVNNFNHKFNYSGENKTSSILDYYAEHAQGKASDNLPLKSGMAYYLFLIDNPDTNHKTVYKTALSDSSPYNLAQSNAFRSRGSGYDINFSLAGNYSNKVYIGGTISFPTINYSSAKTFEETNLNSNIRDYKYSRYYQELDISGSGFNATLGLIFRPNKYVRVGAGIKSPTFYGMNATYTESMTGKTVYYNNSTKSYEDWLDSKEIKGGMDFNLTTPFVVSTGLAFIAGQNGFISLDYEMTDYSLTYMNSTTYSYSAENNAIEKLYDVSQSLRIGGELKLDIFAIRAGYGIYTSPYEVSSRPTSADGSATTFSFGFGVREKDYFIDAAYQNFTTNSFELPYNLETIDVEGATIKSSAGTVLFTMGMYF